MGNHGGTQPAAPWPDDKRQGINRTIHPAVVIVSQLAANGSGRWRLSRFCRIPDHDPTSRLQGVRTVNWMTYVAATTDRTSSGHGLSFAGAIALIMAALASGAAAWTVYPDICAPDSASSQDINTLSFEDRFLPDSGSGLPPRYFAPPVVRSLPPEIEIKLRQAKDQLAQKLQFRDRQAALVEDPTPPSVAAVPVPRPRPVEANLEPRDSPAAAQADNRTLLQKLSDLLPARVTLASLSPSSDGGLLGGGPDLAALGYDHLTAVYDISARTVYMPNGAKLEAHSGLGSLMDDPAHVSERNAGATPPNVYDLKPRERLFHGVQALRMIPVGDSGTLGRSGLLAHSYMLGANGDSNGCVSIKNYEKFLKAFNNGEIKRLVVVPSLGDGVSAARRSVSQS
jgi:Protein of unknown function (DUF2778)